MNDEKSTPLEKILGSFHENPKDRKPDVKKLARLLRGGEPLPPGVGAWLAEVLDPRLHLRHGLEINWRLLPVYVGKYDKGRRADAIEHIVVREIEAKRARGLTVEAAIQQIVSDGEIGKGDSSLRKIWNERRRWRRGAEEAVRKFLAQAARKSHCQDPA